MPTILLINQKFTITDPHDLEIMHVALEENHWNTADEVYKMVDWTWNKPDRVYSHMPMSAKDVEVTLEMMVDMKIAVCTIVNGQRFYHLHPHSSNLILNAGRDVTDEIPEKGTVSEPKTATTEHMQTT